MAPTVEHGRWFCGLAATLFFAAAAHAGPISWSYRVELDGNGTTNGGPVDLPVTSGSFTSIPYVSYAGIDLGHPYYTGTYPSGPPALYVSLTDSYGGKLTITDTASGESGTVPFGGSFTEDWEWGSDPDGGGRWNGLVDYVDFGPHDPQFMLLGGNLYIISVSGGFSGGGATVTFEQPAAPPSAPEPASLGIAVAGLAIAGLRFVAR
ncbi:MAG TPA: hypothetical protein VGF55_23120, partial [Gemmataceae bacterium]